MDSKLLLVILVVAVLSLGVLIAPYVKSNKFNNVCEDLNFSEGFVDMKNGYKICVDYNNNFYKYESIKDNNYFIKLDVR